MLAGNCQPTRNSMIRITKQVHPSYLSNGFISSITLFRICIADVFTRYQYGIIKLVNIFFSLSAEE